VSEKAEDVSCTIRQYARGLTGGLMFSLPLLYTMEMWWAGFLTHPGRLALLIVVTFVLLLGYNRFAGLRSDATWFGVAFDSFEEMGLGLVVSAAVLTLLGRVDWGDPLAENVGRVVVEGMLVSIGISVGATQFTRNEDSEEAGMDDEDAENSCAPNQMGHIVTAACGAVLFAANVGPTDEIPTLAFEMSLARLLLLAVLSLGLGGMIVYFSDFSGSPTQPEHRTPFAIATGTMMSYAVALLVSTGVLYFFGRLDHVPPTAALAQIVVLAFPAVLGSAAGRLLLQ
jgi:putative integral membrane protein (TIGR02587 family)